MGGRRLLVLGAAMGGAALCVGVGLAFAFKDGHGLGCWIAPEHAKAVALQPGRRATGFAWKSAAGRKAAAPVSAVWRTTLPDGAKARLAGRTLYLSGSQFLAAYDAGTGSLRWSRAVNSDWYETTVRRGVVAVVGLTSADPEGYYSTAWEARLRAADGAVLSCRYLADFKEQGPAIDHIANWSWSTSGDRGVLMSGVAGRDENGDDDSTAVVLTSLRTGKLVWRRRLHGLWERLLIHGDRLWVARFAQRPHHGDAPARSFPAWIDLRTGRLHHTGVLTPSISYFWHQVYLAEGRPIVADADASSGFVARAFDLERGRMLWQLPSNAAASALGDAFGRHPGLGVEVRSGRTLLAAAYPESYHGGDPIRLVSLSATTGRIQWVSRSKVADEARWIAFRNLVLSYAAGRFTAYSRADGAVRWRAPVRVGWYTMAGVVVQPRGRLVTSGPRPGSLQVVDPRGPVGRTEGVGRRPDKTEPSLAVGAGLVAIADGRLVLVYRLR